ncbi:MAG: DEAD/DEAH box helicase [Planctomycetes bacterium]|nr:DEAD/DEAH box helicase [Planctomycetota bacterium]
MSDIFDTSSTFASLGMKTEVLRGVEEAGFIHPTDIQAKLLPIILTGRDVIGQAKTGTGKTAAFGLPLLHLCDPAVQMQALILVPTRELAVQVAAEINELGKHTAIRATCIIGGESMQHQARSLKNSGHIIVGTPGRVMDMEGRGQLHFHNVRWAVLDEVDRMLDIGFRDDIRRILKSIDHEHQTIFCSATISGEIERLARSFMKPDAEKITTASGALTVALVDQKYLSVEPWDKRSLLLHLLRHEKPETTIVFCRTKATVHRVATYLADKGLNAHEIHGDLAQNKRVRVMESMRAGKLDVLVASDLASRGIDVEHITHVINYDLPEDPDVYVHRIGRTARAGRRGIAWAFVTSDQGTLLTEIEKLTGVEIEKMEYPDFKPGPVPADAQVSRRPGPVGARPDTATALAAANNARVATTTMDGISAEELARRFPDGVVPSAPPKRNIGSRFRSKR